MGAAALGAAQFLLRWDMDTRGRAPVESGQPRCFVAAESVALPPHGVPPMRVLDTIRPRGVGGGSLMKNHSP